MKFVKCSLFEPLLCCLESNAAFAVWAAELQLQVKYMLTWKVCNTITKFLSDFVGKKWTLCTVLQNYGVQYYLMVLKFELFAIQEHYIHINRIFNNTDHQLFLVLKLFNLHKIRKNSSLCRIKFNSFSPLSLKAQASFLK